MKRSGGVPVSLILPLAVVAIVVVGAPSARAATPLDTLVAAERGFAARSAEAGMKQAFLANLADDAIIFRPGPIDGMPVWSARPESKSRLLWEPSWAEVAGNGDLGITTGPWIFEPADRDTVLAQGHFMTMWKRTPGTPWMVALDLGIDHDPLPHGGYGDVTFEAGVTHAPVTVTSDWPRAGVGVGIGVGSGAFGFGLGTNMSPQQKRDRIMAHENTAMMNADRGYIFDRRGKGPAQALSRVAAPDVHVYRDGHPPARGPMEAIELLKSHPTAIELLPFGSHVASSYDLGYSYGLLLTREKGAPRPDTSGYVHVFRRDDGGRWKLIFDVENAFPKPGH